MPPIPLEPLSEYRHLEETYGVPFDPENLISHSARLWMLAACSHVIWPDFTEYRGMVFRSARFSPENIDDWLAGGTSPASIEYVNNKLTLWDLFEEDDPDHAHLDSVLPLLHETWSCKLDHDFPGRSFIVECSPDSPKSYGPTVSFTSDVS